MIKNNFNGKHAPSRKYSQDEYECKDDVYYDRLIRKVLVRQNFQISKGGD